MNSERNFDDIRHLLFFLFFAYFPKFRHFQELCLTELGVLAKNYSLLNKIFKQVSYKPRSSTNNTSIVVLEITNLLVYRHHIFVVSY